MSCMITCSRTTWPVAVTDATDGAGGTAPAAAGSTPTPTTTAVAMAVSPAINWPEVNTVVRSTAGRPELAGSAAASACALRTRRLARSPNAISGRKLAAATSANDDPVTLTQLGVGSSHNNRPPLVAISRKPPAALNQR